VECAQATARGGAKACTTNGRPPPSARNENNETNSRLERITKLLASEDGKKYLDFDIGKGIDVGETKTIAWDKSPTKWVATGTSKPSTPTNQWAKP
jgi:hypothetical protein